MDPALNHSTAALQIYAVIKARIIDGTYGPDMRLTELQFSAEFETSRTPVREAMRLLAADGLVVFKPNSGTLVRSWTPLQIRQIFEMRVLVESEVAQLAALHITSEQVDQLRQLQDEIESAGCDTGAENRARIAPLNRQFHRIIADACHNDLLVTTLATSIEMPIMQRTFRAYTQQQLQRSFAHHRELIDALHLRDAAWAKSVMSCHIHSAKNTLL